MLAQSELNSIEVLISKALIDWNITHDESVLINNVLKEFYDMKEKMKNFQGQIKVETIYKTKLSYCLKCRKIQTLKI